MRAKYSISKYVNGRWMQIALFDKSVKIDTVIECGYSIALTAYDANDVAVIYVETGEILWEASDYWAQELLERGYHIVNGKVLKER